MSKGKIVKAKAMLTLNTPSHNWNGSVVMSKEAHDLWGGVVQREGGWERSYSIRFKTSNAEAEAKKGVAG